jgi:hypothetical protein
MSSHHLEDVADVVILEAEQMRVGSLKPHEERNWTVRKVDGLGVEEPISPHGSRVGQASASARKRTGNGQPALTATPAADSSAQLSLSVHQATVIEDGCEGK